MNLEKVLSPSAGFETAYKAGFDCGKNGADLINSNYKWFGSMDSTQEWQRGKRDADEENLTNNGRASN